MRQSTTSAKFRAASRHTVRLSNSQCANQPPFALTLSSHRLRLDRRPATVLQVNVGKLCNQACSHCHVDAGPKRSEMMDRKTAERVLELLSSAGNIHTLDITGGAPEINPIFRVLVSGACALKRRVIDRCNLTILSEPGHEELASFLATHRVRVIASMPCYGKENVDKQRGNGVFARSIDGLLRLNELGYGQQDSGLELDLVYNPAGAFLPPAQELLESDYRRELGHRFGIVFNRLYTMTNMPINRFLHQLERDGDLERYMHLLVETFNPLAADKVMCRDLISIGHDGNIYDCDFNQMLDMPMGGQRRSIWDIDNLETLVGSPIACGDHCYGCTAGAGSSCSGSLE